VNLLLKVLQIKDISAFYGIFKGLYNDKTTVNRGYFGESQEKHDFKPFWGVLKILM
jgi:hypothetical protein